MVYSIVLFSLASIVIALLALVKHKIIKLPLKYILTISSVVFLVTICIRAFAADGFIGVVNGGEIKYEEGNYIKKTDVLESLIRWFYLVSECLVLSLIVSKNKGIKWIVSYICLPISVIGIIFFPHSINYYLDPYYVSGIYLVNEIVAAILTVIEYLALFISCLYIHLFEDYKISKSDLRQTIKVGVFSLFICVPFYVYGSLFGWTDIVMQPFNYVHIAWLISIPLVLVGIILLFKKENEETRFSIIAILVFYLVIHYMNCYKFGYRSSRAPFQLCNLAVFLFLIVLLTKWKNLFNFINIANPAGCLVAFICTDTGHIFGFWQIHYFIEHTYVFIIPILMLVFGYMKRPSIKELLRDFFIIFSVYFTFCLLLDGIHNGAVYKGDTDILDEVNFFFLSVCPIKDSLSFYPYLEVVPLNIFGETFYLGYIAFVYAAFSLIALSIYFVPVGIKKLIYIIKLSKNPANS